MKTPVTKKYHRLGILFTILSLLLNIAPLAVYTIMALAGGALIGQKVALTMTVFVVLILSVISWINKTTLRSKIWILMIGLYFVLEHFAVAIIIIGVCQVLDEWIVDPLRKHFRNKYSINKEIDKRG